MIKFFTIKETMAGQVFDISVEDYLEEINRDRLEDWVVITEKDLTEENDYMRDLFEEARYYLLVGVKN